MLTRFLIVLIVEFLLLLVALLFVAYFRVVTAGDNSMKVEKLNRNELKSGDIIGCCYRSFFGYFVRAFSSSVVSHTGIIHVDEIGEVSVLEAAAYGNEFRGVFKIPLTIWLRFNKNSVIGVSRINEPLNGIELENRFIAKRGTTKLDSFSPEWWRLIKLDVVNNRTLEYSTCYEITCEILQEMGVMNYDFNSSAYWPGDLMNGRFATTPKYRYSPMTRIVNNFA